MCRNSETQINSANACTHSCHFWENRHFVNTDHRWNSCHNLEYVMVANLWKSILDDARTGDWWSIHCYHWRHAEVCIHTNKWWQHMLLLSRMKYLRVNLWKQSFMITLDPKPIYQIGAKTVHSDCLLEYYWGHPLNVLPEKLTLTPDYYSSLLKQ